MENIFKKFDLKRLHEKYGIDWQRKDLIKTYKHEGSFTINALVKEFEINSHSLVIIGFSFETPYSQQRNFATISLLPNERKKYSVEFDYWTKADIEKYRKQLNTITYVIVVPSSARIPIKRYEVFLSNVILQSSCTRIIYDSVKNRVYIDGRIYRDYRGSRYISEAEMLRNYAVCLDKSGYSLMYKQRKLQEKLAEKKANKLQMVGSHAFDKENAELKDLILNVKSVLAKALMTATNSDEVKSVEAGLWHFRRIFEDYENHVDKLLKINDLNASYYAKYSSIAEVQNEINRIRVVINSFDLSNIIGVQAC